MVRVGKRQTSVSYVWGTASTPAMCWDTRGLSKQEQDDIATAKYRDRVRHLRQCLNEWKPVANLTNDTEQNEESARDRRSLSGTAESRVTFALVAPDVVPVDYRAHTTLP